MVWCLFCFNKKQADMLTSRCVLVVFNWRVLTLSYIGNKPIWQREHMHFVTKNHLAISLLMVFKLPPVLCF